MLDKCVLVRCRNFQKVRAKAFVQRHLGALGACPVRMVWRAAPTFCKDLLYELKRSWSIGYCVTLPLHMGGFMNHNQDSTFNSRNGQRSTT